MTAQTSLVEQARELLLTDTQRFYALMTAERRRIHGGDPDPMDRIEVDLSGIDLSGQRVCSTSYMHYLNLNDICFEGADLTETTFMRCALLHSRFSGATLRLAEFVNCRLNHADLRGAVLAEGVKFASCDLRWVDCEDSDMQTLQANNCRFRGAKMAGANMQHVELRGCTMDEADFTGADLRWADFSTSSLYGAKGLTRRFYLRHRRVVERSLGFASK